MEFSYSISESDYVSAWKLQQAAGTAGSRMAMKVMFWVFILICLILLWGVVTRTHTQEPVEPAPVAGNPMHAVFVNILPFVLIAGLWVFMLLRLVPRTARALYRKDPVIKGVYTLNITPDSLSMTNTAGFSTQARWSIYRSWREGKNVVVLLMHSGAFFIIGLSGLSEPERVELRTILGTALPGS